MFHCGFKTNVLWPVQKLLSASLKITKIWFRFAHKPFWVRCIYYASNLVTNQILFPKIRYIIIWCFNTTVLLWLWHLGFVIFTLWGVTLRLYGFQVTSPCTDIKTAVKGWERTRPFSEVCGKALPNIGLSFVNLDCISNLVLCQKSTFCIYLMSTYIAMLFN